MAALWAKRLSTRDTGAVANRRLKLPDSGVYQAGLLRENTAERRTLPWSLKSAFVVCFAHANLCFLSAWQQLESRYYDFFLSPLARVDVALRYFFIAVQDGTDL